MSFLERTVRVNGVTLHYLDWGPADAPPVVLLHGITGHARVWDYLAERLVPGRRVVPLDQPGHGGSGAAPRDDYRGGTITHDQAALTGGLRLHPLPPLRDPHGGAIAIQ